MAKTTQPRRPRREFDYEFKAGAVRLVLDEGQSVGRVAREPDLTESAFRNWVRRAHADRTKGQTGLTSEEREELRRLRKEKRRLRVERDVLKNLRARARPSCPKIQTNSRLACRAVSIVIAPWRAPDLGRVGGDVGDSGSPYAQGKHYPATGCHAPGRKPGSRPGPDLDQNVLGQLRRGNLSLDSGLSGGLFSTAGRPCQRPATLFGANVALENRD